MGHGGIRVLLLLLLLFVVVTVTKLVTMHYTKGNDLLFRNSDPGKSSAYRVFS